MKCSGENVILGGIVHVVSGFPLHFMLYRGNFDCFSNRVGWEDVNIMATCAVMHIVHKNRVVQNPVLTTFVIAYLNHAENFTSLKLLNTFLLKKYFSHQSLQILDFDT